MKAIQVQKSGGPEVLTLVDIPAPKPKPGEAVVKVSAAGVNFIDVYVREGIYPSTLPFVIGQEAGGIGIRESSGPITDNRSRFVPHRME